MRAPSTMIVTAHPQTLSRSELTATEQSSLILEKHPVLSRTRKLAGKKVKKEAIMKKSKKSGLMKRNTNMDQSRAALIRLSEARIMS